MASSIVFALIFAVTGFLAFKRYKRIRRNICFGREKTINDRPLERWKNVLLVAFGQKKMFKNWMPAILHLFIYVAFLFTQIELIEIIVDGFSGKHRVFARSLGGFYTLLINFIEVLSLLALVATVVFLARRNLLKVPRFTNPEMKGWPSLDANIILLGEILLIVGIFCMNSADGVLQSRGVEGYPQTGRLWLSSELASLSMLNMSNEALIVMERLGWWLHILVVFGFLLYLPYSKHLHILLAFPNTWYASLEPKGKMSNMPEVESEVRSMLGLSDGSNAEPQEMAYEDIPEFGAKDVFGLSWKNIMDAYSCTECGRCTASCPANQTGKKLSPRKIMMDVRDRAEEVGKNIDTGNIQFIKAEKRADGVKLSRENYDDGKSLFDLISPEELHACTTCNACVEACPVMINPLDIILQMRRYEILTLSSGPSEWMPMFNSLENSGSVWQMSESREAWRQA